jgi:tetratricopeptide (TPR) repeat protein
LTTGRPTDADKAFSEALTIYRDLAARNPGSHQLQLAATLNLFGNLEVNTGRLADAEKVITEAVTIERDLAARGSDDNRFALAITLDNLGNLYSTAGRLADADKAYSEALTIYRDLEASNPAYASNIASLTRALAELRGKLSSSSPPF